MVKVQYNIFSGSIPETLATCEHLEELVLSHNQLEGTIPASFANLAASAKEITVESNSNLQGAMPERLCEAVEYETITYLGADCESVSCPCCHNCTP